jgi:hypothetical protein
MPMPLSYGRKSKSSPLLSPPQTLCSPRLRLQPPSSLLLLFHYLPVTCRAFSHLALYSLTHRKSTAPSWRISRLLTRLLWKNLPSVCPLVRTHATIHLLQRLLMHHKVPAPAGTQVRLPSRLPPSRILLLNGSLLVRTIMSRHLPSHPLTHCQPLKPTCSRTRLLRRL